MNNGFFLTVCSIEVQRFLPSFSTFLGRPIRQIIYSLAHLTFTCVNLAELSTPKFRHHFRLTTTTSRPPCPYQTPLFFSTLQSEVQLSQAFIPESFLISPSRRASWPYPNATSSRQMSQDRRKLPPILHRRSQSQRKASWVQGNEVPSCHQGLYDSRR